MQQKFLEQNRDLLVNINGRLVHRNEAGISPFDSAVQGGDAVWEGLRVYGGRIFKLVEHLERLRGSAQALAFARIPANDEIIAEIRKTLAANRMTDNVHIRLTLTRGVKYTSGMDPRLNTAGPTLIVLAEHKPPVYDKSGLSLITSSVRRFPPDCLDPKIHHCNLIQSILAKIQANQAGADDALMLDQRGFVAETNATHVFLVARDASAWTAAQRNRAAWESGVARDTLVPIAAGQAARAGDPVVLTPYCHACPEGITRATVLELCRENGVPHAEADLSLTDVYRSDEMFCTGTMGELAGVTQVDGRTIGDGKIGAMTLRLSGLFGELTRCEGVPVVG